MAWLSSMHSLYVGLLDSLWGAWSRCRFTEIKLHTDLLKTQLVYQLPKFAVIDFSIFGGVRS